MEERTIKKYTILISSPSDVEKYVKNVQKAIKQYNTEYGLLSGIVFDYKNWKENVYPEYGEQAQDVINRQIVEKSDIVTVHCPLNEQSADMMNKDAFLKMKDGAFFINTARGGIVVEEDLFDALESGKLSGAAVDVLRTEPMSENCVLSNANNIIITPHTAWAPLSTRKRLVGMVAENLRAFLNGEEVNNLAK